MEPKIGRSYTPIVTNVLIDFMTLELYDEFLPGDAFIYEGTYALEYLKLRNTSTEKLYLIPAGQFTKCFKVI